MVSPRIPRLQPWGVVNVGDSLLASVSHLLVIGLGWGTALGTVGALVGRAFTRRTTSPAKEEAAPVA